MKPSPTQIPAADSLRAPTPADAVTLVALPDALWTAVHVKSRCEKVVAEHCSRFHLTHYLPLRRQVKRYQRRNVEVFLPMFGGYIFAQLGEEERDSLALCHKVVHVLRMDRIGEDRLLRDLRDVRTLETAAIEAELVVHPEIATGRPVLICEGPLQGLHGIVDKRAHRTRVTVNVELLGQSVSVELDIGEIAVEE